MTYATAPLPMKVKGTVFVVSFEVLSNDHFVVLRGMKSCNMWEPLRNHFYSYSSEMYSPARLDIITCLKITV